MRHNLRKYVFIAGLAAGAWAWNGDISPMSQGNLTAPAEAVVGAPATPVSYAGVARRTTVRVATPGAGAPGAGVTPGVGAGARGVGAAPANRGGPVNRVGVR